MTTPLPPLAFLQVNLGRLEHAVDVLREAAYSNDMLLARFAAATATEVADRIERQLLDIDQAGKVLTLHPVEVTT